MTVRVVLHIGPMKTGTSAIAAALSAAERRGTMPPGVLYPVDELWFDYDGRIIKHGQVKDLAPLIVGDALRPINLNSTPDAVRAMLTRVVEHARTIEHDGRSTVILINETAGRTADAPAVVRELLALADELVLVLGVRDPRVAAASVIGQGVRTWLRPGERSLSAKRVLRGAMRGPEHDLARLIRVWGGASPLVPLLLLPYLEREKGSGELMARFGELIGVGPLAAPPATARGELVHPGMSLADLKRLARLKRLNAAVGWIPGVRPRIQQRFEAEAHDASQRARPVDTRSFRLSERDARWVLERAQPSIEAVRTHLGAEADSALWREWFAQLDEW